MSILLHGDCIKELAGIDDNSIDLFFCDLPYGQTSCSWDKKINLEELWAEIMRVKKLNTPIFFTTTTKYGVDLINSSPKNCPFRYDLIWVKSAPAGFLSAKKMPMRKHEMVYVFYEKLPFYDLSSHKHKFIKDLNIDKQIIKGENNTYNTEKRKKPIVREKAGKYNPPLPTSLIKEPEKRPDYQINSELYGDIKRTDFKRKGGESMYEPPLPTSVVKEGLRKDKHKTAYGDNIHYHNNQQKNGESIYDPPLPTSLLEIKSTRGKHSTEKPVSLMEWVLKYYSKEGDVVLDPTMGSGSTGVACKNMNRNFIGIELDPEIYEIAVNRIED